MTARKLTLSHVALAVRKARRREQLTASGTGGRSARGDVAGDEDAPGVKKLDRNQMRLHSYYRPSLQAGNYVIEATQKVISGNQSLEISNTRVADDSGQIAGQEFEVVVPHFTLDRNMINSYYPPDGHQDECRILPHISFNDPHFPWLIPPSEDDSLRGIIDSGRAMIPWVALLIFDPDELRIPDAQTMQTLGLPGDSQAAFAKQNPNGTFSMTIKDYLGLPNANRVNYEKDDEAFQEFKKMTDVMTVIFPTKKLLGRLLPKNEVGPNAGYSLEPFKYMSHVRHVNTAGCPEAGAEEQGLFSIVVSSRIGPWDKPGPQTQVCHLVSIEHLESTSKDWPRPPFDENRPERVGIVSLFSWVYTSLPRNPVNFITTMRNLTENQQMLRVDDQTIETLTTAAASASNGGVKSAASKVLADRLRSGYTLSRWRTQTGEETAAFNRGPLVPIPLLPTPASGTSWPATLELADCSNTSQNYQLLDPETGLMDLSYSSAWQTGKLLAISDTIFSSALMRFRSAMYNSTADKTRMTLNGMTRRKVLFQTVQDSIAVVRNRSSGQTGEPNRFRPVTRRRAIAGMHSTPEVLQEWKRNVRSAVRFNASAGDDVIFHDFNPTGHNNSDWVIIHDWLTDKLLLGGIPPQYLLPEPSFLPAESLRFFYIDDFWLDCLIDGALSVANHLDSDDDAVRREMKRSYNEYLRFVDPDIGFKPQIPCYGFIIRSKLIKAMPDLRITVEWEGDDPQATDRAPVCRWTRWDDQTLMALLDRQPQELKGIKLQQPQHQKRFSLGDSVTLDSSNNVQVSFQLRQLYTEDPNHAPPKDWPPVPPTRQPKATMTTSWLNPGTRGIEMTKLAKDINGILCLETQYTDNIPNSAELGLSLNDPAYYFLIQPPTPGHALPPRDRQLYVRPRAPAPPTPTPLVAPTSLIAPLPDPAPRPRRATAPLTHPGPLPRAPHNQLRIQPRPPTSPSTQAGRALATATLQTRFDLTVFADYKGPPTRFPQNKYHPADYLATENIYFYDVIFSIRKKTIAQASQFQLLKIVIDIPVASNPPAMNVEALLTPTYDGQGVRMLSNQRFVPFLFNDDPGEPLHVELVPRSANDDYTITLNDRKTRELGFRLAEANVSPVVVNTFVEIEGERVRQKRGKVDIVMTEWYSTPAAPKGEPVQTRYSVIKFATRDDTDMG